LLAVSGGVDSTVVAFLLKKAIDKNLYLIYVDTGLMRKDESKSIISFLKKILVKILFLLMEKGYF